MSNRAYKLDHVRWRQRKAAAEAKRQAALIAGNSARVAAANEQIVGLDASEPRYEQYVKRAHSETWLQTIVKIVGLFILGTIGPAVALVFLIWFLFT